MRQRDNPDDCSRHTELELPSRSRYRPRRACPTASKQQIREFLSLFVSAFAFSESEKLKLQPEDRPYHIYRALYPHRWQADALEFETLCRDLQQRYSLDLEHVWEEDLTLGELFDHALQAEAHAA